MKRAVVLILFAILVGVPWPASSLARGLSAPIGERSETSTQHRTIGFRGTVRRGETFSRKLTNHLAFLLVPVEQGWRIDVRDDRLKVGLTQLTPPFHGINPIDIQGWHFRNAENTGTNTGDVNAPQEDREFIFSSRFGRATEGGNESYWSSPEQVCEAAKDGHGTLVISDLRLGNLVRGGRAWIEEMRFKVKIELADRKFEYLSFCQQ
jgi:hypothetical protein